MGLGLDEARDGRSRLVDFGLRDLVGFARRRDDAVVHVVFEQVDRDRIERGLHGRNLREDVDAVLALRDHALQAAHLTLDAAQARKMILGVAVVAVLVAHGSDSTPRGYGCQGGVVNERCGGGDAHPPMRRAQPQPAHEDLSAIDSGPDPPGRRRGGEVIMGKLLRVGGMRRCCSPIYIPQGYMFKGWRARPSRGAGCGHRAAASLSGGDSGRRRANTAPRPGPGEVAVRVPPWASINALEMVRPIPAPPLSRLRAAQKAAKAGALASKWNTVKTVVATQGRNLGAAMKESRVVEDIVKDALSGGVNNVTAYYMDDSVKDKSLMGAIGMFGTGAISSAAGAVFGGNLKTRFNVNGYSASDVLERGRFKNGAINGMVDVGSGMLKTTVQYTPEAWIENKEIQPGELKDKMVKGAVKDFSKSYLKSSVKMDAGVAQKYRTLGQYYAYRAADTVANPAGALDRAVEQILPIELMKRVDW